MGFMFAIFLVFANTDYEYMWYFIRSNNETVESMRGIQ
jgi:hypothetical protein